MCRLKVVIGVPLQPLSWPSSSLALQPSSPGVFLWPPASSYRWSSYWCQGHSNDTQREKGFPSVLHWWESSMRLKLNCFELLGGMDDSALSRRKNKDSTRLIYHGDVGLSLATIVSQEVRALTAFSADKPHWPCDGGFAAHYGIDTRKAVAPRL